MRFLSVTALVLTLFAVAFPAHAACMTNLDGRVTCDLGKCKADLNGKVFCSRFKDGHAVANPYGKVACGKGKCLTTLDGNIICSDQPGGSVKADADGNITCAGKCEPALESFCSSSP